MKQKVLLLVSCFFVDSTAWCHFSALLICQVKCSSAPLYFKLTPQNHNLCLEGTKDAMTRPCSEAGSNLFYNLC